MRKSFFGFLVLVGVLVVLLSISSLGRPSRTESQTTVEETEQIKKEIQKGIKYAKREEFKKAQKSFDGALTKHPENAAAYNNLANLDLLAGKYASAMQKYWHALQYNKTDTNIYLNLGVVYYLQMEITRKEVYVDGKESEAPWKDWEAHSASAFNKAFTNVKSAAEACFLLSIPSAKKPEYSWVHTQLQDAAERMGIPGDLKPGGGTSLSGWKIPVYWKIK